MKIKVHYTFLILLNISILCGLFNDILAVFLIILLHELGHLIFLKYYKRETESLTIFPYGGIIKYQSDKNTFLYEDFLISIGGIIINVILFFILFFTARGTLLYKYNIEIMLFNILPIFPLDGGRALEILLGKILKFRYSLLATFLISILCIIVLFFINILTSNLLIFTLVLLYLILENYQAFKDRELRYYHFLLNKLLHPNDKLKNKEIKNPNNLIKQFYKGVNNVIGKSNKKIKESQILKKYFNSFKR